MKQIGANEYKAVLKSGTQKAKNPVLQDTDKRMVVVVQMRSGKAADDRQLGVGKEATSAVANASRLERFLQPD